MLRNLQSCALTACCFFIASTLAISQANPASNPESRFSKQADLQGKVEEGNNADRLRAAEALLLDKKNLRSIDHALDTLMALDMEGYSPAQLKLARMYDGAGPVAPDLARAFDWYGKAAEQGDVSAQNRMGEMLFQGFGTERNVALAVQWMLKAAQKGFVPAQINLAEIYGGGLGVQYDPESALHWANKAIESQSADAFAILGYLQFLGVGSVPKKAEGCSLLERAHEGYEWMCYWAGTGRPKDKNRATSILADAAKRFRSQEEDSWEIHSHLHDRSLLPAWLEWFLSTAYERGEGVPQDSRYSEALALTAARTAEAFAQYDFSAQVLLAAINQMGSGIRPDNVEAARLYSLATDSGDSFALAALAELYLQGNGVPKDIPEAIHLLKESSARDNDEATVRLGLVYFGPPLFVQSPETDLAKAFALFNRAADREYPVGERYVGYCYEFGRGVAQDYGKAASWYRKAADQNDPIAMNNLGLLYEQGHGVPKDLHQAADWVQKAAELNNAVAQRNYGMYYMFGRARPKDYVQAVFWLHKAADQGDAEATKHLAEIYQNGGHGVAKEHNQAEFWTARAAALGKPVEPKAPSTGPTLATLLTQTALNLQQQKLQGQALNRQALSQALQQTATDEAAKQANNGQTQYRPERQAKSDAETEASDTPPPPALQPSDVLITQNSLDANCTSGSSTLRYGLTNNSAFSVVVTLSINYQIGGVKNSLNPTLTVGAHSSSSYSQRLGCSDREDSTDYGTLSIAHSEIDQAQR